MADELRRFPSLDSRRAPSSQQTRRWKSASTSLTSRRSSLSRFPSLHSTRASRRTSITTATSPSLLICECDDGNAEYELSGHVDVPEPANASLYKETPLLNVGSIRILRIKPGSPGTPLECELLTTTLDEQKNRYSVLSYTWHQETACESICINGRMFDMQQSLVDFICTLRSPHRHMRVWVDAICIDQQSLLEKTHQAQLLSSLYSNAACTQLWLGHDMPTLANQMKLVRRRPKPSDDRSDGSTNLVAEDVLLALLNHHCWTRTWILQEVLLAKDVWIHCGSEALQWNNFVKMARHLANSLHLSSLRHLELFGDSNLIHLHNLRRSTRSRGLPELLSNFAKTDHENVQDRLFGLIGLINERNDPLFAADISESVNLDRKEIIDYSLPPRNLFQRLMDTYPLVPADSFAIPLWSALNLDDCPSDSFEFGQRIRVQGFPCSMLTMSRLHRSTLTGAGSMMNQDNTLREELLCLSDPYSKAEARQSRMCVAIRINTNGFQTNERYLASACLVESRGLALNDTDCDNLCRAFESTCVYRESQSGDTENIWTIDLPLTALKALHAITNPNACQRLLDTLAEDVPNTTDIGNDPVEWVEASKILALPPLYETENVTLEHEHLRPEQVTHELLPVEPPEQLKHQRLPVRTKSRYKALRRARLSGIYDFMVRPLYGDRLPAWK